VGEDDRIVYLTTDGDGVELEELYDPACPAALRHPAEAALRHLIAAEPLAVWLDGPITDPQALDAERQGTVCTDDVGEIRQRRYADTHLRAGWTSRGCDPLTSTELTERGTRPVWVVRFAAQRPGSR